MKHPFLYLAAVLASLLLSALPVSAQTDLPSDVVTALRLESAQEDTVRAYVDLHGPRLTDNDTRTRQQARNALLRPLTGSSGDPSPAFRLVYNRLLYGPLRDLEQHEELGIALGALRIAGWLGAENGYLALRRAINDDRSAVRYGAALGLGRLLAIEADGRGVLPGQRIDETIELLETRMAEETDIQVVDGVVLALTGVPEGAGLRTRTMTALVRGGVMQIARRRDTVKEASEHEVLTLLRAMTNVRDRLTGAVRVEQSFALQAMEFAGHALSYSLVQLESAPANEQFRQRLLSMAVTSEATLILGHDAIRREQLSERVRPAFEQALAGGPIAPAQRAVMSWIGPGGTLSQAPYNMDPRRFVGDGASR